MKLLPCAHSCQYQQIAAERDANAKAREQLRQMIDGKVADDQHHSRTIAAISERQAQELSALHQRCEEAEAKLTLAPEEPK